MSFTYLGDFYGVRVNRITSRIFYLMFYKLFMLNRSRFPNYSYNSATSKLMIQCTPSPVHENLVSTIFSGFSSAVDALPLPIQSSISVVAGQGFTDFKGAYSFSSRIPDLAIKSTDNEGVTDIKFALEVGFLETYEELVEDARLWLEGTSTVLMVLIIKLEEDPSYKCPIRRLTDDDFARLMFPPMNEINREPFVFDGPYGPVSYQGFQWCGRITGYMEYWAPHAVTGLANRIGNRMVSYTLPHL